MVYSKKMLKKIIQNWIKAEKGSGKQNERKKAQAWYDAQVQCSVLKLDFEEVEKFVVGKKSKFKLSQLD
jgi:hypothetical protein